MRIKTVTIGALFALLALPIAAEAQGIPGGAAYGYREGGRIAGPVGAVVGAGVGGVVGGVEGALGIRRDEIHPGRPRAYRARIHRSRYGWNKRYAPKRYVGRPARAR